ncbi:hypothetical protein BD779DRAFT_1479096 [Infundibulicybe gibba]|nr:hypothetical protein BD779DRAFT_1479096 [Infundibulicybe gibba]
MSTCLDAAAALSSDVYEPSPSVVTPLRCIARIALTLLPLCVWAQACIMPCGVRQGSRSLAGVSAAGNPDRPLPLWTAYRRPRIGVRQGSKSSAQSRPAVCGQWVISGRATALLVPMQLWAVMGFE